MTASFHDTRWTLVSRSRGNDPHAKAALSELCDAYYAPVVAFLRRDGRDEDAARDLAHDFFAKLLAGGAIDGADSLRGRFRTYLLAALKHFAADQRARGQAAKRGGGIFHEVIEGESHETGSGLQIADAKAEAPDVAFDRQWALTVLSRAMCSLGASLATEGKAILFETLKPHLTADPETLPLRQVGESLGLSEDAVKMAIHRLRKRFREAVKTEISQTVQNPVAVQDEMTALTQALRGG